jgi:hypothetical protein
MQTQLRTGILIAVMTGSIFNASAQPGDSVVIRVGKESKVIFSIKDKRDLETLKHYDFQALMEDMVQKLEKRDTTSLAKPSSEYLKDSTQTSASPSSTENWERDRDRDEEENDHHYRRSDHRTHHSFNIDLGMNNYLENGKFPDANNPLYTVKPWGSWYVGLNSVLRTHVGGKFFVEWGGGVSWYNFKFNNEKVTLSKDDNGVIFSEDTRTLDFQKSKLTAAYVNASVVPMIDFGGNSRRSTFFDRHHSRSFRFGAGPYAGYRIDSYSKQMYKNDGDKTREHNHDNFYLNNFRYGLRFQFGFRDTDLFFNYDLNELFTEGKGPKLNAFSFGITL